MTRIAYKRHELLLESVSWLSRSIRCDVAYFMWLVMKDQVSDAIQLCGSLGLQYYLLCAMIFHETVYVLI